MNNTVRYLEQGKLKISTASSSKEKSQVPPAPPLCPAFTMDGNAKFQFEVSKKKGNFLLSKPFVALYFKNCNYCTCENSMGILFENKTNILFKNKLTLCFPTMQTGRTYRKVAGPHVRVCVWGNPSSCALYIMPQYTHTHKTMNEIP